MAVIFNERNEISGYDLVAVIDDLQRKIYNTAPTNQAIVTSMYDSVTTYNFTGKFITKVDALSVSIEYYLPIAKYLNLHIKVNAQHVEMEDGSICDKLLHLILPIATPDYDGQLVEQVENWIAAQADVPTINQLSTIYDLLEQQITLMEVLASEMK